MIDAIVFVLLVTAITGLPLAHWSHMPWRRR